MNEGTTPHHEPRSGTEYLALLAIEQSQDQKDRARNRVLDVKGKLMDAYGRYIPPKSKEKRPVEAHVLQVNKDQIVEFVSKWYANPVIDRHYLEILRQHTDHCLDSRTGTILITPDTSNEALLRAVVRYYYGRPPNLDWPYLEHGGANYIQNEILPGKSRPDMNPVSRFFYADLIEKYGEERVNLFYFAEPRNPFKYGDIRAEVNHQHELETFVANEL